MIIFNMGVTVGAEHLVAMRLVARSCGQSRDGPYEDRVDYINLWCTPYDKPRCWDLQFRTGEGQFPREHVGTLSWRNAPAQRVELMLHVDAYNLRRTRRKWQLGRRDLKQVREWMQAKALSLVRAAAIPS
jgi:hypothetical protein